VNKPAGFVRIDQMVNDKQGVVNEQNVGVGSHQSEIVFGSWCILGLAEPAAGRIDTGIPPAFIPL
jgi:hypothetical protein